MRGWVALGVTFAVALLAPGPARADDRATCQPVVTGSGHVTAVIDGRTLQLADGRQVRLAGLNAADSARNTLEALLKNRDVTLMRAGPASDRYGRILALVTPKDDGGPSVQETLLRRGEARILPGIAETGCIAALQAAEKVGRDAELGMWNDPDYLVWDAGSPAEILERRGHFALVEGTVRSVRESGATIYVNFGRRWSEDFTVTVPKRDERNFARSGMVLKKLAGRHVRVRGMIEERGGPWIEATHPEQIEVAEQP